MEETARELVRLVSCPEKGNFRSSLSEAHRWLLLFSCLLVPLFPPGALTGNPALELCSENHCVCVLGEGGCSHESAWMPVCWGQTDTKVDHRQRVQHAATSLLYLQKCGFLSDRDFKLAQLYCPFLLR